MKQLTKLLTAATLAVVLTSGAYAADSVVTPAQIAAAKTPADHEAIAVAYDKEAARLEARAKEHEEVAKSYQAAGATQKGYNAASMAMHCKRLAETYAAAAKESRELAKEHRTMK
jgi:hypothetical protein